MKHELRSLLAVCSIMAMLLFPAHASATHGTNPPNTHDTNAWNLAGRPFTGTSGLPWQAHCHGIAYGRVNGYKVLFTARHCNGGWDRDGNNTEDGFESQPNDGIPDGGLDSWDGYSDGELIWDRYGNYLGIWRQPAATAFYDLAYIQLGAYVWPTNPHQVYGGVHPDTGATIWRSITYQRPPVGLSCASIDDLVGATIYNSFQSYWTNTGGASTYYNRIGTYDGFTMDGISNCKLWTNLPAHCNACFVDSGSPLHITGFGGVPGAFAREKEGCANPPCDGTDLIFQPTYPGMAALHDLYHPQYGGLGAYFCTTAACP